MLPQPRAPLGLSHLPLGHVTPEPRWKDTQGPWELRAPLRLSPALALGSLRFCSDLSFSTIK